MEFDHTPNRPTILPQPAKAASVLLALALGLVVACTKAAQPPSPTPPVPPPTSATPEPPTAPSQTPYPTYTRYPTYTPAATAAPQATPTASAAERTPATATPTTPPEVTAVVTAERGLNLRAGPGTAYPRLGTVSQGAVVVLDARDPTGAWVRARVPPDDAQGWLAADYLDIQGSLAALAVSAAEIPDSEGAPPTQPQSTAALSAGVSVLPNHSSARDADGNVRLAGEVANDTTTTLAAVAVAADFFDATGAVVDTASTYTSLLYLPSHAKTCFELLADPPDWASYELRTLDYRTTGDDPTVNLTVAQQAGAFDPDTGKYTITGQIRNDGANRARHVQVVATLYNSAGNVAGCRTSHVDYVHLDPGQASYFAIELDAGDFGDDLADYRLQADGQLWQPDQQPGDAFAPTAATGMSVTRGHVAAAFEALGVTFAPLAGPRGAGYVVGSQEAGPTNVFVELIGPAEDLLYASVRIVAPAEDQANVAPSGTPYLETLMRAIVPDAEAGTQWLNTNLPVARSSGRVRAAYGDLLVTLTASELVNTESVSLAIEARR